MFSSSLYSSVSTRQPCIPSSSGSGASSVSPRPLHRHHSSLPGACNSRWTADKLHTYSACATRSSVCAHAVQQQHGSLFDKDPFFHDHVYTPPAWHPRLFGLKPSKRAALEEAVQLYYKEVWNAGSTDLLDELADSSVCFNDVLGMEEDAFSRASLKQVIEEFQASHPLLRYDLEDIIVDEERNMVVVHYTVTAAHLLPQADGKPASGHVSTVPGMDKFHFNSRGLISSILSFRQRFMEEEVQLIDWDTV